MLMRRLPVVILAALMLASCGSGGPEPVRQGPRLGASLAAQWPTTAPARQLVFSHAGSLLATSDASGQIVVRDACTWRPLAQLQHEGGATSLAFGADDKTLFSAGYDGKVRAWDLGRRSLPRVLEGSGPAIWTIDASPDGSLLAAGSEDGAIRVWNLHSVAPPRVLPGHERNVWEVRFSPDGKLLASGSFDRSARIWDVATGKPLRTLAGHKQAVVGLAFSPDGKLLATCGDDSTIRFWRVADGAPVRTIQAGNHTYKLAFSSDGRWLASGGRAYGAIGTFWHQLTGGGGAVTPVRLWRTADGALVNALPSDDDVPNLSFSPDQRWLATSGEDNRVRLWRLQASSKED
jgi:WD40 repeat protein